MFRSSLRSLTSRVAQRSIYSSKIVRMNEQAIPVVKQVASQEKGNNRLKQFEVEHVSLAESLVRTDSVPFRTQDYTEDYFTAPVVNWNRELVSKKELPNEIFGEVLRPDIIHRCLISRISQRRAADGIKPTKTVSTISGSGRKPRPQKGSGRARQGKVRSNIIKGGEKAHGRVARDISINLPSKVLRLGMRSALSAKYALGQIVVLDQMKFDSCKTRDLNKMLQKNKWGNRVLFLDTGISKELRISSHAIPLVYFSTLRTVNIYDILRKNLIVMTPRCVDELVTLYHPLESARKEKKTLERRRMEDVRAARQVKRSDEYKKRVALRAAKAEAEQ